MKKIAIVTITFYQQIISPLLHQVLGTSSLCRYSVSCSEFAKQVIHKNGIIKGGYKTVIRILSCQPWIDTKKNPYSS